MGAEVENALYTVATPIGNLGDITLRALEVLKGVDVIACEDTRITSRLCEKYSISTRLISYHKFSENSKIELFLNYLKEGKSIALVSDAGTPLISDPGESLVKNVLKEGFKVIPIVGASAINALLSSVYREQENFKFVGFLARTQSKIEKAFLDNRFENLVFYESPNRILETLKHLQNVRPDSKIAFGRELTKKFEEIKILNTIDAIEHFEANSPRGEFVVMIYADNMVNDSSDLIEKVKILKEQNLSDKDVTKVLTALFDYNKNEIKKLLF